MRRDDARCVEDCASKIEESGYILEEVNIEILMLPPRSLCYARNTTYRDRVRIDATGESCLRHYVNVDIRAASFRVHKRENFKYLGSFIVESSKILCQQKHRHPFYSLPLAEEVSSMKKQ